MNKMLGVGQGSVAVLLPVHNAERYLREAMESMISQTFGNYRLIVVDDASSDSSWSIIEGFDDSRIVKIRLSEPKGIVNALNTALEVAGTEFVARMDADDIARNDRFEKQVDFLKSHPEVGVCGSSIKIIKDGLSCYVRYPESHDEILCSLAIYKRSFCHPTVMMRRSVLNQHKMQYTEEYQHAEDLSLWHGLMHETRFHNLQEPLLAYRVHMEQVSSCYKEEQISQTRALLNWSLPKYFPSLSSHSRKALLSLVMPESRHEGIKTDHVDLPNLYARMEAANRDDRFSVPATFNKLLLAKFLEASLKRYLGLCNTAFVLQKVLRKNPGLLLDNANRLFLHIRYYLRVSWVK
jgi:glycosyltransferase involved in cell wall biosynthesis